jgi:hypothetical protein
LETFHLREATTSLSQIGSAFAPLLGIELADGILGRLIALSQFSGKQMNGEVKEIKQLSPGS